MSSKRLLDIMGEIDEGFIAEAAHVKRAPHGRAAWVKWGAVAACLVLLISVCFGSFAIVAEAEEYRTAVQFFNDHGMSADGLTRGEIKAVYRDITTESFTYFRTSEVILNSISDDRVDGFEIAQEAPTPEDVENLWNYKNYAGGFIGTDPEGIRYEHRYEYTMDESLGYEVFNRSFIEKYDDETLLWSVAVSEFEIDDICAVSDGVIAYGWQRKGPATYAWLAKVGSDGDLLWKQRLNNGFIDEYIAKVLENADGSYAVFSRGDLKYFCLNQFTEDGSLMYFSKTEVGDCGIWNAARSDDGYIVQLDKSRIVKVDHEGNITEEFSYSGDDERYYLTDMIEYNGNIYLSAYAVPKRPDDDQNVGGGEIADIIDYLYDPENGIDVWEITSEELTPLVRNNYTAVLLVCDPNGGRPHEFYSVRGSLGGSLSVSDTGMLLWDVESIMTTFFSPATSAFSIGGTSYVFKYTFDDSGWLIGQETTGEITNFYR